MPRPLLLLLLLGLATAAPAAPAAAQTEAWQPPTLTITRYDEDWTTLRDPGERNDHWTGPFKYIAVSDDAYLSTGLEFRLRNEAYRNNLWGGADAPDDGYLWARLVPYADLHVGRARAFVQPIIAYAAGIAPSAGPVDQTRVDLLQGFADVEIGPLTLRAGRQMLSLGTERLVGTRYGPNVPLAFDGARGIVSAGPATISLFAVRPVQPGPGSFDDERARGKSLWGAYATLPGLDLYYLGYRNTTARFGGRTGRELRHSVGARSFGTAGDWHWNVEGVVQVGRFASRTIGAWTIGTEVGKAFPNARFAPDATMRFNVVSGDGDGSDDRLGTFNALFPKGKYFGELSPVGPANIVSLNPRLAMTLAPGVSASVSGMAYWRYARADGVYDVPGNLLRAPNGSRARFIGKELEATLAWQATPELELSTSLSAFDAGRFIDDTGPGRTIAMLGLESNFRF